jgi:RNA-binding protein
MPSGELRRALRGHGHRLSAIVQVGKGGISDGLVKQVEQALADHELVKLKVAGEGPADRFEVAERLAALPGVNVVQIVGGAILLYKRHPSEPRYEGPRAPTAAKPAARVAAAPARAERARRRPKRTEKRTEKRTAKRTEKKPEQRTARKPERAIPGRGARARVRARRS